MKHAPTPYYLDIDKSSPVWEYSIRVKTYMGPGRQIANLNPYVNPFREGYEVEDQAAFIIKACNSHDDLIEALEALQKAIRETVKLDVKKHYSLMVIDAEATKLLTRIEGV